MRGPVTILRSVLLTILTAGTLAAGALAVGGLASPPSYAAEIQADPAQKTLRLSGPPAQGDDEALQAAFDAQHSAAREEMIGSDWTVVLDGSGGDETAAMALGRRLRKLALPARVPAGRTCAGPCLLTLLGGTQRYATGIGIGRLIEPGADLVVIGASDPSGEGLRAILAYLEEMRGIERGLIADAYLSGEPVKLRRPAQFAALGLTLTALPAASPPDPLALCQNVVRGLLPALDPALVENDISQRVEAKVTPLDSTALLHSLAQMIRSSDRFAAAVKETAKTAAGDRKIYTRYAETVFELSPDHLPAHAWVVGLSRGAGFYADRCYVMPAVEGFTVLIVDAGQMRVQHVERPASAALPPDKPLW